MQSHPMWVRGLKLFGCFVATGLLVSHPMWVRGLKPLDEPLKCEPYLESHPMWVRGLKLNLISYGILR